MAHKHEIDESTLPDVGELHGEAQVGPVVKPFQGYARLPALDDGEDWRSNPADHNHWAAYMPPYFYRNTTVFHKVGRLGTRGYELTREQMGQADQERPYERGQSLTLKIVRDSEWQMQSRKLRNDELSPRDKVTKFGAYAAGLIAAGAALVVGIGGNGEKLSDDEQNAEATKRVITAVQTMSAKRQYMNFYFNGGEGNEVSSFDDNRGRDILNTGLVRWIADMNEANITMGDACMDEESYSLKGGAKYRERANGNVAFVTEAGSKLVFEIKDGVLQPKAEHTIRQLSSAGCTTKGIPTSINGATEFVVPFDAATTN